MDVPEGSVLLKGFHQVGDAGGRDKVSEVGGV